MQGRWLLIPLGMVILLCLGSVYSWSLFRTPLEQELGMGATESLLPFTFVLVFYAALMPITGYHLPHLGTRLTTVVGGVIVLISMHLFYAKPDSLLANGGESRKGGLTVSPSMEHFGAVPPSRTQSSSSFDSAGSVEGLGTVEEGYGSPASLGVARSRSGFGADREPLLPR